MPDDEHDRLKHLSSQIGQIRSEEAAATAKTAEADKNASNMSLGARAGAELISFTVAGGLIGWALDSQFETKPLFLVVFLLAGVCTGFYEVYRITNNMGRAVGYADVKKQGRK
jgi:ATP synthase protein I